MAPAPGPDRAREDAAEESRWRVEAAATGERLDRHLAGRLGIARNRVQGWIAGGRVTVDGAPGKPSHRLVEGEEIVCRKPPPPAEPRVVPEPGELSLLYQDPHLAVVDKPAGLVVHPGAGRATGTLAHRLLALFPEMAGVGGPGRPGIVHRLDRDTTGVLVAARTAEAYDALSRAFASRRISKRYLAIVHGAPRPPAGAVEAPIGRHPSRRQEMAVRPAGRRATTRYRTLAARAGIALVELDLVTGRTHQIRVHLKALGHPLVGDPVYGEARWRHLPRSRQGPYRELGRPALHAWRLGLEHPVAGGWREFEAPVPADLVGLWTAVAGEPFPALPG